LITRTAVTTSQSPCNRPSRRSITTYILFLPFRALQDLNVEQVYASIVGDCAWAEGGCPVTQQNFVDLVYSELAATGKSVWPSSTDVLVSNRIAPIFKWANFTAAEGVPYLNFNDYLHYFRSN
jgi:hypothetical protein